jgi:hypothetical protein
VRLSCCTALHCTALHCAVLYCTVLHCTALHCTLHCTVLHCIVLSSSLPCSTSKIQSTTLDLRCTAIVKSLYSSLARLYIAFPPVEVYRLKALICKCIFWLSWGGSSCHFRSFGGIFGVSNAVSTAAGTTTTFGTETAKVIGILIELFVVPKVVLTDTVSS